MGSAIHELGERRSLAPGLVSGDEFFASRVNARSRRDAGIFHGDIAILNRQGQVSDRQIALVITDNEANLKRHHRNEGAILLRAAKADVEDFVVRASDDRQVTIAGRFGGARRPHGGFRK